MDTPVSLVHLVIRFRIEQSLAAKNSYTVTEAHAIMDELNKVNQSLKDGEKEKMSLLQVRLDLSKNFPLCFICFAF